MEQLTLLYTILGVLPSRRSDGLTGPFEKDQEGARIERLLRGLFALVKDAALLAETLANVISGTLRKTSLFGVEVVIPSPSSELIETAIMNVLCTQMRERPELRPHVQMAYEHAFEASWQRMLAATQSGSSFGQDLRVQARNALLHRLNDLVAQGQNEQLFSSKDLRTRLAALLIEGRFGLVQDLVRAFYWTGIFSDGEQRLPTVFVNREVLPNSSIYDAMHKVSDDAVLQAKGSMLPGRQWALAALFMRSGQELATSFNTGSIETLAGDVIALDLRHVFEVMTDEAICQPNRCQRRGQALTLWQELGGDERRVSELSAFTMWPQLTLTDRGVNVASVTSPQDILLRLLWRGEWASAYLLLQELGWTGVFTRTLLRGVRGGGYYSDPRHSENVRVERALTALLPAAFVQGYLQTPAKHWGSVAALGQQLLLRIDEVRAHLFAEIQLRDDKEMKALEAAIVHSKVLRESGFSVGAMSEYIVYDAEYGPPSPELVAQKKAFEERQVHEADELIRWLRSMIQTALKEAVENCQPIRLNVFE